MVCYVVYLLMANYKNVFVPLFVKLNSSAIFVFYLYAPVQPMVAAWRVQMFLYNQGLPRHLSLSRFFCNNAKFPYGFILNVFIQKNTEHV